MRALISNHFITRWLCTLTSALLVFASLYANAQSDSVIERRVLVGLKIFRTLVAADLNISEKVNSTNSLPILILYANNRVKALEYGEHLKSISNTINDLPIEVIIKPINHLQPEENQQYAAVFISQKLDNNEINLAVNYGATQHVVVFSPFEGDVERGVLGGLSVQATVRPLVNIKALNTSQLAIKPFYLKVAKLYE